MTAAKLKTQLSNEVPALTRDIDLAENILSKYRTAGGMENKTKIEQLYARFDDVSKQVGIFTTQRNSTAKQLNEFIKTHSSVIQSMIDAIVENGREPVERYLRALKEQKQLLNSVHSSLGMLRKEFERSQQGLTELSKEGIGAINALPETKRKTVGEMPKLDTPRIDD